MDMLRWPPDQTAETLAVNPDYVLAFRYFLHNATLTGLALLFGLGLLALLLKHTRQGTLKVHAGMLALLSVSSGMGIILGELFLLALLQQLTWDRVTQAFALTGVISLGALLHARRELWSLLARPLISLSSCVTVLVILLLAILQMASVGAPSVGDSTSFHMPYAEDFFRHHGLMVDEHLIYPYHALNASLLYSMALMLEHSLTYAQSVHALFATLTLFAIYAGCRALRLRSSIGIALAFLFVQVYTVRFNRYAAMADFQGLFFITTSALALVLWGQDKASRWLLAASGIALGLAMGTKYILCVFALPVAIYIVYRERRASVKTLLQYAAWTSLFGLWWYIRNWISTGNPLHPFAAGIFGYYLWDHSDMVSQMQALGNVFVSRNLLGLLLMPWQAWHNEVLSQQHAAILITMLYASTALCWLASRTANTLLLFAWVGLVSWMFGSQDPRHLLPIEALVCIHAGAVLDGALSRLAALLPGKQAFPRLWKYTGMLLSGSLVLLALAYAGWYVREEFVRIYYSLLAPGEAQETNMRNLPVYDLVQHANEVFGENDTVYEFMNRDGRWFFHSHVVGAPYGPHGYWHIIDRSTNADGVGISPQRLEENLRHDYGASGFVIPNTTPDEGSLPYNQADFDRWFELVYRNRESSVYRFRAH